MERMISAEEHLHKSYPTSMSLRVIHIGAGAPPQLHCLKRVPVEQGIIHSSSMRRAHQMAKDVVVTPSRARAVVFMNFDGDHDQVIQGELPDLTVEEVSPNMNVHTHKVLPRFHGLSSLLFVLERYEPHRTRRAERSCRVRFTRRSRAGSLKTNDVVLST